MNFPKRDKYLTNPGTSTHQTQSCKFNILYTICIAYITETVRHFHNMAHIQQLIVISFELHTTLWLVEYPEQYQWLWILLSRVSAHQFSSQAGSATFRS